jgi:hypothetical protein
MKGRASSERQNAGEPLRHRRATAALSATIVAVLATLLLLSSSVGATTSSASATISSSPVISHVGLRWGAGGNVTVTIQGTGFGQSPVPVPYYGNSLYLVIVDSAQLGYSNYGFGQDGNVLFYQEWSPSRIVVSSFFPSPGDAFEITVWSTATATGMSAAGNVPPRIANEPSIRNVDFSGSGRHLHITITGSDFGAAPHALPFTGDLNFFSFTDSRIHFETNPSLFGAGGSYFGLGSNAVTLVYTSWTDTKIVISGFAGAYSHHGWVVEKGDPVNFVVWNTGDTSFTGLQTAWGGLIT